MHLKVVVGTALVILGLLVLVYVKDTPRTKEGLELGQSSAPQNPLRSFKFFLAFLLIWAGVFLLIHTF
jgi:hypothetical protein